MDPFLLETNSSLSEMNAGDPSSNSVEMSADERLLAPIGHLGSLPQ
jgi:hypothetical protein